MNSLKNYKNKVIAGKKILLRKLKKGDLKYCIVWLRDPEVNKFLSHGLKDVTEDQELEWYDFISNSDNDLVFAIISKTNKKYI